MTDKMLASVGIALGTVGTSLSIVCGVILCLAHFKPGVVFKNYMTREDIGRAIDCHTHSVDGGCVTPESFVSDQV